MTQCERIREHLESGGTLTPLEALQMFGCLSLSQRVGELERDYGMLIEHTLVKVNGSGKHVMQYSLKTTRRADMENIA